MRCSHGKAGRPNEHHKALHVAQRLHQPVHLKARHRLSHREDFAETLDAAPLVLDPTCRHDAVKFTEDIVGEHIRAKQVGPRVALPQAHEVGAAAGPLPRNVGVKSGTVGQ